ncbi:hypothetical protein [Thalassotalea sp. G2M2-11]|uniref:hypothetical protein n=1 Tax=Thalassotalea sp. G2M2-11 TaxID=2787627 RepID=UPI0019CFF6F8|nr:hypothetical protein [Thalassotalea sp. G2M2-11]
MKSVLPLLSILVAVNVIFSTNATNWHQLTVEELRLEQAKSDIPEVFKPLAQRVSLFKSQIRKARNLTALTQLIIRHGHGLWKDAVISVDNLQSFDDRSLYWSRLMMSKTLRTSNAFQALLPMQQQQLLWKFELISRGSHDVKFSRSAKKKILLTGFDPFFLDRDISQSNPSGVTALALDDLSISLDGINAEIETMIVPVRFADFDQGMIEELLSPYYHKVDMIVTVSMGRTDFDLERFPARRRSAKAPDNVNIFTGASSTDPILPKLNGKDITGPEFVEFSLPVSMMSKIQQPFNVNDNRLVETLGQAKFAATDLAQIENKISVSGSGGGYLSNEISYRSIVMREKFNPMLPVGHIHTPSFKGFEPETSKKISQQVKRMLTQALKGI